MSNQVAIQVCKIQNVKQISQQLCDFLFFFNYFSLFVFVFYKCWQPDEVFRSPCQSSYFRHSVRSGAYGSQNSRLGRMKWFKDRDKADCFELEREDDEGCKYGNDSKMIGYVKMCDYIKVERHETNSDLNITT